MTGGSVGSRPAQRTREGVIAALLAALLAASAWIAIPVGTVPLTLQLFIVLLAGLLLPPRGALFAVGTYLLLGAAGLPVFSGGLGGIGVLLGPTGGYLVGFLLAAVMISGLRRMVPADRAGVAVDVFALTLGVIIIYLVGWAQLAFVTGMGLHAAFAAGVLPFIGFDSLKAIAALLVARALSRAGYAV
ncbi:MAG: biotin transporter BioY [Coriobacteriia bacterium]|jgi:biotin transport system substrate-specific component|nr:biotin transporter BioY [Coriobacteriia bacterium]